jgi:HK97 gp10 family phage protein
LKQQIYIKGLDALERETNKIIKDLSEEKTKLLLGQAQIVRDRIKEKAPRGKTGNLKKAAYAAALPETTTSVAVAFAGIRPRKAPHAHLVEFGHGGPHPAPAHPFIRPAWEETKEQVRENIKSGLKQVVERRV